MAKRNLIIFPSKAVTASETGSTAIEKSGKSAGTGCVELAVTALSAGGSVTVTVQDYVGSQWHDLVSFNQASATGKQISRSVTAFGTKLRTLYTLVGTATFAVTGCFDRAK